MSNTPARPPVEGISWYLEMDGEPAYSTDAARLVAAELGNVIVPVEPEDGTGCWICTTDADLFDTLVEVGWVGLDNGGGAAAEANW